MKEFNLIREIYKSFKMLEQFRYNPKTKQARIIHLIFIHNLLMFMFLLYEIIEALLFQSMLTYIGIIFIIYFTYISRLVRKEILRKY